MSSSMQIGTIVDISCDGMCYRTAITDANESTRTYRCGNGMIINDSNSSWQVIFQGEGYNKVFDAVISLAA